jgi:hypothetical protein
MSSDYSQHGVEMERLWHWCAMTGSRPERIRCGATRHRR